MKVSHIYTSLSYTPGRSPNKTGFQLYVYPNVPFWAPPLPSPTYSPLFSFLHLPTHPIPSLPFSLPFLHLMLSLPCPSPLYPYLLLTSTHSPPLSYSYHYPFPNPFLPTPLPPYPMPYRVKKFGHSESMRAHWSILQVDNKKARYIADMNSKIEWAIQHVHYQTNNYNNPQT